MQGWPSAAISIAVVRSEVFRFALLRWTAHATQIQPGTSVKYVNEIYVRKRNVPQWCNAKFRILHDIYLKIWEVFVWFWFAFRRGLTTQWVVGCGHGGKLRWRAAWANCGSSRLSSQPWDYKVADRWLEADKRLTPPALCRRWLFGSSTWPLLPLLSCTGKAEAEAGHPPFEKSKIPKRWASILWAWDFTILAISQMSRKPREMSCLVQCLWSFYSFGITEDLPVYFSPRFSTLKFLGKSVPNLLPSGREAKMNLDNSRPTLDFHPVNSGQMQPYSTGMDTPTDNEIPSMVAEYLSKVRKTRCELVDVRSQKD